MLLAAVVIASLAFGFVLGRVWEMRQVMEGGSGTLSGSQAIGPAESIQPSAWLRRSYVDKQTKEPNGLYRCNRATCQRFISGEERLPFV